MSASDSLIPTRFLVTLAHLLATIMLFDSYEHNIRVAITSDADAGDYDSKETTMKICLYVSVGCIAVGLLSLFSGCTMFRNGLSLFHIVANFIGCVLLSFFMTETWHFEFYYRIFGLFSCFPAIVELSVILGMKCRGD